MYRSTVAAALATVLTAGTLATGVTPAEAAPYSNPLALVCHGGETNSVDRRIDTMLVRLDMSKGAVRGYWVQYGDEVKTGPGVKKIDASPMFIALPPDPEQYPGPYLLDFKESYTIDTNASVMTPDAAVPDVLTYRDTADWRIRAGGTLTVEGRIFGILGNFSSCGFGWQF
jgi:hypothetical protein